MKYSIEYSKTAVRDLDRVWEEVLKASQSYDTAGRYVNDLLDKIEAKADYPESGAPLYYQDSFTGYYFVIFKAYLAFYRVKDETIRVDRILYGKSDYMRCLHLV